MKLAIVVQRYGADIGGGSELHARYIAERLAAHADVRVLTTCARDYVTWRNEYPPGHERINSIPVERFPVARERDTKDFWRRSSLVFDHAHSVRDEWAWLDAQGPFCPELVARVQRSGQEFDAVVAFSLRYYSALHAARVAPCPAVIVPTTERDPVLGLSIMGSALRSASAIMYNAPEERALIQAIVDTASVPGVTVGVGSHVPATTDPARARRLFGLNQPFVIYVGRIDANKGCDQLFDYFSRFAASSDRALDLVLVGRPTLPIPQHPRIRHVGYVDDQDKFDLMSAAEALVMPSPFESLSMVALEAWALGRPVLANGRCDVLVGQCLRSNGGLFYRNGREFEAMLDALLSDGALANRLGAQGRAYYDAHYAWPIIERKYLDVLGTLTGPHAPQRARAPRVGWLEQRRRRLPPASQVVDSAPAGPAQHTSNSPGLPS